MRACDAARAGSAKSAQAAAVRRTVLNLDRESFDMATPRGLPWLLEHGSAPGVVKLEGSPRVLRPLACRSRAGGHLHDPLRPRPHYVDNGGVVVNLLQNRLDGLQFYEIPPPGLVFHALQLVVEGKFLIAVIVGEAPAELESGSDALKQRRQLLDDGH